MNDNVGMNSESIILERMIKDLNLLDKTVEISKSNNYSYKILTGLNLELDNEEKYIIFDYRNIVNNQNEDEFNFNLDEYLEIVKSENETEVAIVVMIFDSWKKEQELFWMVYDKLNAMNKKKLTEFFGMKISIYTSMSDTIEFMVEQQGINYLEYSLNESCLDLEGYIYNISFGELFKLFNVTGSNLFRKNVRNGLKNSSTGNKIKDKFMSYLKVYIYNHLAKTASDIEKKQIKNVLELDDEKEYLTLSNPEQFWFYHNGITIFSYGDEKINFSDDRIRLNPSKVSVINGAQTMTNFFMGSEMLKRRIDKGDIYIDGIDKRTLIDLVDQGCYNIKVKTIVIQGDESFVKPITYGLNTQIPVLEENIIADSNYVNNINKHLKKEGMKILKEGEEALYSQSFSVLDFTKKYIMIKGEPGKSKNLQRSSIEGFVREANEKFKINEEEMISKFHTLCFLDDWWFKSRKQREELYTDENSIAINHYGKNYFGSFILRQDTFDLTDENLLTYYTSFITEMIRAKQEITPGELIVLGDFKKDALYFKYLELVEGLDDAKTISNSSSLMHVKIKEHLDDLKDYIKKEQQSPYTLNKVINEWLIKNLNLELDNFRVIATDKMKCRECYAFPNTTFSELYLSEDGYKEFKDSRWWQELNKDIPVFIVDHNFTDVINDISTIKFIPNFSFKKYLSSAEEVYEKTIQAFVEGDEMKFVKISDDLDFHIRPKAINAEDTFEFSNGQQITKRTFWANKSTVEDIISDLLTDESE